MYCIRSRPASIAFKMLWEGSEKDILHFFSGEGKTIIKKKKIKKTHHQKNLDQFVRNMISKISIAIHLNIYEKFCKYCIWKTLALS